MNALMMNDDILDQLKALPLETVRVIAGPTGSFKSKLALQAAERLGGIILNADSRQFFQALPLLTAHPSQEDYEKVPHYLYGYLPWDCPKVTCSAWAEKACNIITRAHKEGEKVWVVGGTGFYLRVLEEGLSPLPSIPSDVEQSFLQEWKGANQHDLLTRVKECDPDHKAKDRQRLLRSLLVYQATGKPLSEWKKAPRKKPPFSFYNILIIPEKERLAQNLEKRFLAMVEQGVIDEVREFCSRPSWGSSLLSQSIGLFPLWNFIQEGISFEECKNLYLKSVRAYAKRQRTWFNHQFAPNVRVEHVEFS